jgi:iron complex outermembrane receptor protein
MRSARFFFIVVLFAAPVFGQNAGMIKGTVSLAEKDLTLPHVTVLISQLGRSVETGDDGAYEFQNVPAGTYDLVASRAGMSSLLQSVQVMAGQTATSDFKMSLSPIRQEITVTATGVEVPTFESFQTVSTLDSFALAEKQAASLGEVLDNQPGVAKRSFGPGTARPVIRGFDGDRVLIMQDGVRTGTLSSQSGDHGEPIDVMSIERLEVVKGPATLLYGSNAIGGVVNAVSRHFQMKEQSQDGIRGYVSGTGGTNNKNGAGSTGFELGNHNFLLWANAGQQKTQDYKAGKDQLVVNSATRLTNGGIGLGWFGDRAFNSFGYTYDDGIYGIPFEQGEEELVRLKFLRRDARFSGAVQNLGFLDRFRYDFNYSGWRHKELNFIDPDDVELGTLFDNRQYTYQFAVDQKHTQRLNGTLGFYGMHRNYFTQGEEAIAPPVKGNIAAVFGLEEVSFERFKLQFGGRLEDTRYNPEVREPKTTFTGLSAAAGINIPLWMNGAFVANYTHSYRAPALEELYNNGPHPGNLTFEVGDPNLKHESGDGVDFSLRHINDRLRAEANFYYYNMTNFVFLAPTGEEEDGLRVANYSQGNTRYRGTELVLNASVHPNLWVDLGLDYVSAELKTTKTPLPRIPPLRGHIGIEGRYRGFSVKPELVMANKQDKVFTNETETPGYTVVNLTAAYTLPARHFSHHFALNAFNLGDRLYFNHVSFIKDLAPEIGRGVRFTYSVRFF